MLQSVPLFPLSTEWRARGPHCHSSEVQRATLRVPVHCAYLVEPTLSLKCFLRAHTQTGKVSAVCSVEPRPKTRKSTRLDHQLGHAAMLSVADICQARTKVYRCDLCILWGLQKCTYPIMGMDPVAPTRQPPPRPPSTCGRAPPKGLR